MPRLWGYTDDLPLTATSPSPRCRICGDPQRCTTRLWSKTPSYCKTHQPTYRKLLGSAIRNRAVNTLNRIAWHVELLRELFAEAMDLEHDGYWLYPPGFALDAIDWVYWRDRAVSRRGAQYSTIFNTRGDNIIHRILAQGYDYDHPLPTEAAVVEFADFRPARGVRSPGEAIGAPSTYS